MRGVSHSFARIKNVLTVFVALGVGGLRLSQRWQQMAASSRCSDARARPDSEPGNPVTDLQKEDQMSWY